jgi:hypothetical protein
MLVVQIHPLALMLNERFKWPDTKPSVPPDDGPNWLADDCKALIAKHTGPVVVELGSWLGRSTRYILGLNPETRVICIDHWLGGAANHKAHFEKMLPVAYETFLVNCWEYRDRITPVKLPTHLGLYEVHAAGIRPNLIYVDASHDYHDVMLDILLSRKLFPSAKIIGDDFGWTHPVSKKREVRMAVEAVCQIGVPLRETGRGWAIG